jgi:hypothetical protein
VDINIKNVPDEIRREYLEILGGPIKTGVKKAAKQIKQTKAHLGRLLDFGVLIIVNNGYGSLPYDEFENLTLLLARKETSQIDFIICITVALHPGMVDAYVFCVTHYYPINAGLEHPISEEIINIIGEQFDEAMTKMMREQIMPQTPLKPVKEIVFERDETRFIFHAPEGPNSRLRTLSKK